MAEGTLGLGRFPPVIGVFRILFQNRGGAEGEDEPIFHAAHQGKADGIAASFAAGKAAVHEQGRRVHQAMRTVLHAIDAAGGHMLARLER